VAFHNIALPIMEPPVPVEFVSMERLRQIYASLPAMFAKDIARRQQMNTPTSPPTVPPPNIGNSNLKRERPDDILMDVSSKRRDTGDHKLSTMLPPAVPSVPLSNPSHAPQNHFPVPSLNGSPAGMQSQPIQIGSPSMPPPMRPPGLPTDAQVAASNRERARQMQIQQALAQQQNGRQMSPPSGPSVGFQQAMPGQQGQQNAAAGPSMPNAANMNATLAAFGPNAMQNFNILQNPQHPFYLYMCQAVPGFRELHVQQQLEKMRMMQVRRAQPFRPTGAS
jgi:hypothetical protein